MTALREKKRPSPEEILCRHEANIASLHAKGKSALLGHACCDYAGIMAVYIRLQEDAANWERFFSTLEIIPAEHLGAADLIIISKVSRLEAFPDGFLERIRTALRREAEQSPSALKALDAIYRRMSGTDTPYDDMAPIISGAAGDVLVELIERIEKEQGRQAAIGQVCRFFNKNYVDGKEERDPDRPINRKLLIEFNSLIDEELADVTPEQALEILIKLGKGLKSRLKTRLYERETTYVEILGQELDALIAQNPPEALAKIKILQALENPNGDLDRSYGTVFVPMLLERFERALEALRAAGREEEVLELCREFNKEQTHFLLEEAARTHLGIEQDAAPDDSPDIALG